MNNDLEEFIKELRKIIEELIGEDNEDLLDWFSQLDLNYQVQLINSLKIPQEDEEEYINGWLTCLKEGHDWSCWYKDYQKEKDVSYSEVSGERIIEYKEVPIWKRKCKRCAIEEMKCYDNVPEEIVNLRNKNKELVKKYQENKLKNKK